MEIIIVCDGGNVMKGNELVVRRNELMERYGKKEMSPL